MVTRKEIDKIVEAIIDEGFLSDEFNKRKQDLADRKEDAINRAVRINKIRKQREKQQRLNQG